MATLMIVKTVSRLPLAAVETALMLTSEMTATAARAISGGMAMPLVITSGATCSGGGTMP